MKQLKIFILTIIAISAFSISCSNKNNNEKNITVSILPQKYLTERICGNTYNINVLIPPGENPATCELTTKQIKLLLNSKLYFSIGFLPYETNHIRNILEKHQNVRHINLSQNLELVRDMIKHGDHYHEGGIDPHVWMSASNVKDICETIYKNLVNTFPKDSKMFDNNYNELIGDIESLDIKISNTLQNKINRNFIIYHPALTYFARDYGMNQISLEYEGKSPSPKHIQNIIEVAKKTNTRIVLVQKQFDIEKANFIAKEINGKVIAIDPLNENWLEEMNKLLNILDKNLE